MSVLLEEAYLAVCDGYSEDRVVCDPELNSRFISECRRRGLEDAAALLNKALLNLRKAGRLSGRRRSVRTRVRKAEEYRFAAEMAARFLERREKLTLDDILCDTRLASEFDKLAADLAPGFSSLEYRWAALNLRKARRFRPELIARVSPPVQVIRHRVADLALSQLPLTQGLYLLFDGGTLLYIGEATNIRARMKKHLDHSDNRGLARWLWQNSPSRLHLEIQVLDPSTPNRTRKALEAELISSREPVFNVK
jgi:site-specific DNA-methyltransferase (adenine-specific)